MSFLAANAVVTTTTVVGVVVSAAAYQKDYDKNPNPLATAVVIAE